MADKETLSSLSSLRTEFARKAAREYPQVTLPNNGHNGAVTAAFYKKTGDKILTAEGSVERGDIKAALEQLSDANSDVARKSARLALNAEDCRRFSDDRTLLEAQAEEMKNYSKRLDSVIRHLASAEKRQLEAAGADPATMLRLAEILKKDITYNNEYSNIADIQKILVLSAEIQQRQEKLIRELAEKVDRLEKQLAEEPAPILDKSRLAPPARPPQP
ncbi:MAG: hypothetical protein ACAH80_03475 [Alphaproteobacteria bacterium]